jgi:hypothetical protein
MRRRSSVLHACVFATAGLTLLAPPAGAATYYVATTGSDAGPGTLAAPWRTIQKAADTVAAGDTVLIRSGTYAERVVLVASGTPGAEITFAAYPGEVPIIDGTGVAMPDALSGLLDIEGIGHVRVRGLRIQNAGPYRENAGILLDTAHHVVLEHNSTYDTASSGIGVWNSDNVTIDGNDVALACNDGQQEAITIGNTSAYEVKNNVVHDGGPGTWGGEGICVKDGSRSGRVFGNHVFRLNRLGIYVDAEYRHTYDADVYGNLVHDTTDGIVLGAEAGALLENVRVHDNVVYATRYRGLLILDAGLPVAHPMKDLWLVNNTLRENGTSGWGGGIAVDNPDATGVVVLNNIASQNTSFQVLVGLTMPPTAVTVDHNLIDGFRGDPEGETRGTNYVEGDPLFAGAAGRDLHLLPGSPAIDAGAPTAVSTRDYEGVPRPQGAAPDTGAFEFAVPAPLSFYTAAPCRVVDTRNPDMGGPAPLVAGDDAVFTIAGHCGVPASAKAVSLNVTVTAPTWPGHLRLYPADRARPLASTLNFVAGQTRANNAVVRLDDLGRLCVYVGQGQGTTHVVIDTTGYFE